MIFKSLKQLSASVVVVTSKKINAVAVGWCVRAKLEPPGTIILFKASIVHHFLSLVVSGPFL